MPDGGGSGVAKGDFNGDGFGDLAIGVPFEDVNGVPDNGAVSVIYGSETGLTATGNQFWWEFSPGITGGGKIGNQQGIHFGWALAAGNFNGDDYSDLAIGAPDADVVASGGIYRKAGRVLVLFGSENGLVSSGHQYLVGVEHRGRMGAALAWGHFNSDTYGDLAIGIPGMTVGVSLFFPEELVFPEEAGQVSVRYGSETGFSGTSTQSFFQGNPFENDSQVGEQREAFDRFGSVLAAGDFNADQLDDLAIGVPNEDVGGEFDAGLVHILYGSQIGLARFSDILTQAVSGVSGTPEPGDRFGAALAVGNLNGDGIRTSGGGVGSMNDLVVGAPGEAIGSDMVAGAVHVFFGSLAGITTSESQFWSQDEIGSFSSEPADQFGKAIAVADFDGDGKEDLAIGVPGEDMGGKTDVGVVHILYGTPSGPTLSRRQNWNQDTSGMIGGGAGNSDFFGSTLSAWNFGKSGHADLAVAAPGRDYFPAPFAHPELSRFQVGMVSVIYGSSSRLTVTGNQQWHQDSPGILDSNEDDDQFGKALY